MKSQLGKTHLLVGLLALIIFLLTGAYMRWRLMPLMEASDRLRFSLRGNHVYILWSALLNLIAGAYLRVAPSGWRAKLQLTGSLLIMLSSAIVIIAFFHESKASPERPITLLAMITALTGTALQVFSTFRERWKDV
jgi:membrane protein implicated in regulation of membrane protease activity